jgi:hypothetical protein
VARFYADEDFSGQAVVALRILGHDVLTAYEAGQANQKTPDEAVLAFAHAHGRAVLTFNRWDFIRMHNQGTEHSGIVACKREPSAGDLALRIHEATKGELKDQLIRINRPARKDVANNPSTRRRRILRPGDEGYGGIDEA